MAPRYSKKKAKYTYTERVLGALSDIQKDHRKNAVHMATLRAHIRKAANTRKDRLGPQWSQWVSRTVQRLANDGILDTSDPHGNVTFTPDAKKTVTDIRRESLGPGTNPSPAMEHKIWKDVTRRFSTIGVKRPRSSGIGAGDENGARPRKRQARKSLSGFTKAELEAELKEALQRLDEAEEYQAVDVQDELDGLRDELRKREEEVEQLREEVTRLKDNHPNVHRVTIGTTTRLHTPPLTNASELSPTPSTSRTVTAAHQQVPAHGMTRTLSGSLISNLTKQPTPEPSESGSHDAEIEDIFFDDAHERPLSPHHPLGDDHDIAFDYGLETPQDSPMISHLDDFDANSEARHEHDDRSAEIVSLKNEVEAQASQLRQLRGERIHLLAERDELRVSVASRDDRVASLEAEVRSRSEALTAGQLRVAEFEDALQSQKARFLQLEAELQEARTARDQEKERYSALEGEHGNLRDMVESLQSKVDCLSLRSQSLQSSLTEARSAADDWQSVSRHSEAQLHEANIEVARLEDELRSAQDSAGALQKEFEQSQASSELVNVDLERTKNELTSVQEELGVARRIFAAGNVAQLSMSSQITELKAELDSARNQIGVLTALRQTLKRTIAGLEETVAIVREELSQAKDETALKSAGLQRSLDTVNSLRTSYTQALSEASTSAREAAALKVAVSDLELTLDGLRSQLEDSAAEAADVRARLVTEEAFRRSANSQLVATGEERDRLLADIADKTALLTTTTEELEQARQAIDDARRQNASLVALRESDVAAHLTERSALESRLETSRAEAAGLETEVEGLSSELLTISEKLSLAVSERDQLLKAVEDWTTRSSRLEEELSVALDDVRDAEEEIEELRQAKMADEASIQSLKDLLARLRQAQLDAVEEVNNKMISAQTAPTPDHRRRSSIATRRSVVQRHV